MIRIAIYIICPTIFVYLCTAFIIWDYDVIGMLSEADGVDRTVWLFILIFCIGFFTMAAEDFR